jgi:hypothetical protein
MKMCMRRLQPVIELLQAFDAAGCAHSRTTVTTFPRISRVP